MRSGRHPLRLGVEPDRQRPVSSLGIRGQDVAAVMDAARRLFVNLEAVAAVGADAFQAFEVASILAVRLPAPDRCPAWDACPEPPSAAGFDDTCSKIFAMRSGASPRGRARSAATRARSLGVRTKT